MSFISSQGLDATYSTLTLKNPISIPTPVQATANTQIGYVETLAIVAQPLTTATVATFQSAMGLGTYSFEVNFQVLAAAGVTITGSSTVTVRLFNAGVITAIETLTNVLSSTNADAINYNFPLSGAFYNGNAANTQITLTFGGGAVNLLNTSFYRLVRIA